MSPEEAYAAAVDASGAGVSAIFVTGDPAQMLRAALASLRVSGYVVVPVEPTEAMVEAGFNAAIINYEPGEDIYLRNAASVYRAMLAAIQEPPHD